MPLLHTLKADACCGLIGFEVVDCSRQAVGTLCSLWAEQRAGRVQFLGVHTAATAGRGLLVPAEGVQVDPARRSIRLRCPAALIHAAPAYASSAELTPERKGEIYRHYHVHATLYPRLSTLCRQA